ncbi:hypothetical protein SAMN05216330_12024 [Bradyrhizobium sp. Ghvi]|nr:hypothetical protein SAMN05216330_12024 [Bradyrhizobium sp. Ghvi]
MEHWQERELKKRSSMLQIRIYDAMPKARAEARLPKVEFLA